MSVIGCFKLACMCLLTCSMRSTYIPNATVIRFVVFIFRGSFFCGCFRICHRSYVDNSCCWPRFSHKASPSYVSPIRAVRMVKAERNCHRAPFFLFSLVGDLLAAFARLVIPLRHFLKFCFSFFPNGTPLHSEFLSGFLFLGDALFFQRHLFRCVSLW